MGAIAFERKLIQGSGAPATLIRSSGLSSTIRRFPCKTCFLALRPFINLLQAEETGSSPSFWSLPSVTKGSCNKGPCL